jgi:predicted LPLAT superfamily acyltransferase
MSSATRRAAREAPREGGAIDEPAGPARAAGDDGDAATPSEPAWRRRPEAGTLLGIRFLEWVALVLGRHVLHLLLGPVTLYFLLMRRSERRASRAFLTRVTGRPASSAQVMRHFLTFARVTADRIYFLTGRDDRVPVRLQGADALHRLVDEGRGGIFLAAHLGSFEAARAAGLQHPGVVMRIVLDRSVGRKLMGRLEAVNPEFARTVIDTEQSAPGLGLEIAGSLGRGEWIGFLADRYHPGDRVTSCDFLGAPAKFPLGPFMIASAFRVPVVFVFPVYARGRYEIHFETLSESFSVPRQDRQALLGAVVQHFADRLAEHARRAPYNWFNFYDFWA